MLRHPSGQKKKEVYLELNGYKINFSYFCILATVILLK